jgi:DNA-binding MarR family transcriptional regulator
MTRPRNSKAPAPKPRAARNAAPRDARRPPAPALDPDALERAKRASPAQLLFRCARRLNELALARVAERTGLALRPSHTALFPHLDLEGTRQSELARRLGVSKQAVHQLVSELEEMGVLERVPDPHDRRATRVRFGRTRGRTLLDGLAVLGELERDLARDVGVERMRALHETLAALDAWLDSR